MLYLESPDLLVTDGVTVFLAGGITGCSDWQAQVVEQFDQSEELRNVEFTILNPRRKNFDVTDKDAARAQITWEWHALKMADVRLFWFTADTIQPIVLFELGRWSGRHRPGNLVVGADPAYSRRQDVVEQLRLERPGLTVHDNLGAVVVETSRHILNSPVF